MRFTFRIGFDDEVMVGAVRWVKRYLITPMGGYFPVLVKLQNGDLAVVFRMGDYHIGQRGRIEIATSRDGDKHRLRLSQLRPTGGRNNLYRLLCHHMPNLQPIRKSRGRRGVSGGNLLGVGLEKTAMLTWR